MVLPGILRQAATCDFTKVAGRSLRLHPGPCFALQLDQVCPSAVESGLKFVSRSLTGAFPGTLSPAAGTAVGDTCPISAGVAASYT